MAKWALLTALQSVRGGAAAPRSIGADGRALAKPWRLRSEAAVLAARRLRAQRRQPIWPRLVGVSCLGVAIVFAVDPVGPLPRNVAASSSARPGASLQTVVPVFPAGALATPPGRFEWSRSLLPATTRLIVLDAGYQPIDTIDGIAANAASTPPALHARLAAGGTFHWYVVAEANGASVKSPLETFTIR